MEANVWPAAEGKYEFPEVTEVEILDQAKKIPSGKAPGPAGVPDLVIKNMARSRPDILRKMYNLCLGAGDFLTIWKKATLVLLHNPCAILINLRLTGKYAY